MMKSNPATPETEIVHLHWDVQTLVHRNFKEVHIQKNFYDTHLKAIKVFVISVDQLRDMRKSQLKIDV